MKPDSRIEELRAIRDDTLQGTRLRQIAAGAIDAYEERLRVNVGLLADNVKLRRQLGIADSDNPEGDKATEVSSKSSPTGEVVDGQTGESRLHPQSAAGSVELHDKGDADSARSSAASEAQINRADMGEYLPPSDGRSRFYVAPKGTDLEN